ncbi:hypothetical protein BH11PLA2_BH11PLA2_27900 [soil metagenome]
MTLAIGSTSVYADAAKPTYADDVLPVLRASCLSCHSDDKQKGGLNLATFAATIAGGSSGAVVTAGQPEKSRLYTLSNHSEEPKMPPKADKLKDAQLNILKLWIEQGARENAGSKVVSVSKPAAAITASITKGRPAGPPPMPGTLSLDPVVRGRRAGAVLALAASPWAPLVAIGSTKQILLYNSDTAELLGVLPYPHGQINNIKFSRNGKLLLAAGGRGGQLGKATLYDLATGKVIVEVGNETDALLAADVSADQSQIAVGGPSKVVRIYSTADGSVIREIKKHTDWVTAVEYSPDGVLLASGDRNGGVFVWETPTGQEFFSLRGHTLGINDLSWRDDANQLASASEDSSIRIWEMENGRQIASLNGGGGVASVRYAHDGRLVSVGRDRIAKLWDTQGKVQKQFEALPDLGLRVAITHDFSRVIAGDWAGNVKAWTVADAKVVAVLDVNPAPVAERVQVAEKAVVDVEAKLKQVTDAFLAAKAAGDKANAELAVFQKAVADTTAEVQGNKAAVGTTKAEVDKQAAAFATAQAGEEAISLTVQALTDAANKVKAAAAKAPANAALKAQSEKVEAIVKNATLDHVLAKQTLAAVQAAKNVADFKHAAVLKDTTVSEAKLAPVQQKLTAEQAARKPVLDAMAAAQANVTAAQAAVAAAKANLEKLKASLPKK